MATVAPMLLSSTPSTPVGEDWVLEPKWDGFRFLYRLSRGGEVQCWTRHGKRHGRKLPYIDAELRGLFPDETVLDGELVALGRGPNGVVRHDFERLRSILATRSAHRPSAQTPALQYVVFDVLELGGADLRHRSWRERRAALEAAVDAPSDHVSLTETLEPSEECDERLIAAGFEGSVYKRRSSPTAAADDRQAGSSARRATSSRSSSALSSPARGSSNGRAAPSRWTTGWYVSAMPRCANRRLASCSPRSPRSSLVTQRALSSRA